jgi:hypothetical protein
MTRSRLEKNELAQLWLDRCLEKYGLAPLWLDQGLKIWASPALDKLRLEKYGLAYVWLDRGLKNMGSIFDQKKPSH